MKSIIKKWLGIDKLQFTVNMLEEQSKKIKRCRKCGLLCHVDDMKVIKYLSNFVEYPLYYCEDHAPKYDRLDRGRFYKSNVEVNEQGKPIN